MFTSLGNPVILPADEGPVRLGGLEEDRAVVTALDLGKHVERDGNRIELAIVPRLGVLDGQIVVRETVQ